MGFRRRGKKEAKDIKKDLEKNSKQNKTTKQHAQIEQ